MNKYRVILADPPWFYSNWAGKENGAAKAHYPCMGLGDIARLPVGRVAADDCALLLWITGPKLAEGAHTRLFDAWGFRPVTMAFVWNKTTAAGAPYCGLGFYVRSGAEFCLLGARGRVPRREGATKVLQVITAPRSGRHSEKPQETYERIEALWDGPYLELFARAPRKNWDSWGNEVDTSVNLW